MHYRRFGKTDLNISIFSLGTMRCLASAEAAHSVLAAAVAQGINHIETARGYGQSEQFIGQALKTGIGRPRSELVVTSKLTPSPDADRIERQLDESLARLGIDYLDCLAIHGINTPEHLSQVQAGMLGAIAKFLNDGRVRHVGFSTHGPLAVVLGVIATDAFEFINLHYYYFFQRLAPAVTLAHEKDMGIFIISPADKGGMLYTPPDKLHQLCAPFDPLGLTYRWLLSDPRITTLSIGPAVPQELAVPLQVADQTDPLSEAEQQALARVAQQQPSALGPDQCSQCYQCLPCPEAIHIPEVLRLRNLAVAYDMTSFGQYRYRMFENAGHWFPGRKGSRCTDCGDCLPRCP
ncbi:MAG: aldo/keto reductase, partial [Cyanobacteria bacterium P01_D01_bin.44]